MCTIARTTSVYTTVILTIERYVVVSYPLKSQAWMIYRPWKCRLTLLAVLIFSVFIKVPWNCQSTIEPNEFFEGSILRTTKFEMLEDESLEDIKGFPFLILRNTLGKEFPRCLKQALLVLDVLVPFPILVLFNALAFKKVIKTFIQKHQI